MSVDLETLLRANLDPAANGSGRPLAEYDLRVEVLQDGVLALHLHPKGFVSSFTVFGVKGNAVIDDAALAEQIATMRSQREAERKAADEAHAAEVARQRTKQAELQAQAENEAAERARAMRPVDISEGTADP